MERKEMSDWQPAAHEDYLLARGEFLDHRLTIHNRENCPQLRPGRALPHEVQCAFAYLGFQTRLLLILRQITIQRAGSLSPARRYNSQQ